MRAPTNYAGPRRKTDDDHTVSQSKETILPKGDANVQHILDKKGNAVFSIKADDVMQKAVDILREKRIGALLVTTDAGALEGILSERDIVRKLSETPGHVLKQHVRDLMTSRVKTCSPGDSLTDVLRVMTEGRFRHMPVVDNGNLLGMVTIGDVVHFRLDELEHQTVKMKQMIVG